MEGAGGQGVVLRGIAVSQGVAVARAIVVKKRTPAIARRHPVDVARELSRFNDAVGKAMEELREIRGKALQELGADEAEIFEGHMLILEDPAFAGQVREKIGRESVDAESALMEVTEQIAAAFETMDSEYLRERAADIRDVGQRVLAVLQGAGDPFAPPPDEPVVIVARDLTPSDTARLDRTRVAGIAADAGGKTSHAAIMARAMGIPAVVGLKNASELVSSGATVIVDGSRGHLVVNPSAAQIAEYDRERESVRKQREVPAPPLPAKTATADGRTVELFANIGSPADLPGALASGAEGVGLFRTEFLFMDRGAFPSEEEQYEAYKAVAEGMGNRPVIIRTLDVGGDKDLPYLSLPGETNPFLGCRAIRLCLERGGLFKTQLRAILRAGAHGRVKIMYPMITTVSELRRANEILSEAKEELAAENIPFDPAVEAGVMVETPAAAVAADILAKEADFFSIGTNDLIQYTMACDRMNESIAHLYQPFHPSVLRLIKMAIDAARRHGKPVGMCGEMASDRIAVPLLLGLGLDEFSMSASSISDIRRLIGELRRADMENLAGEALALESHEAVFALVTERLPFLAP